MEPVVTEQVGGGQFRYTRLRGEYFIRFPHMQVDLPDPYGFPRLDQERLIWEGEWLTSTSLNWLMKAMSTIHSSLSQPPDVLYTLPAGAPSINSNEKLTDMEQPFQPGEGRHAIIFRLFNTGSNHWIALVHFHTINSIVVFDSLGVSGNINMKSDVPTAAALRSHARFIHGSAAVPRQSATPQLSFQREKLQQDNWSCGLWCMGFTDTLFSLLSERRALDGETIDCTRLRDALVAEVTNGKIRPMPLLEAHRLLRNAWTSQQSPEIYM